MHVIDRAQRIEYRTRASICSGNVNLSKARRQYLKSKRILPFFALHATTGDDLFVFITRGWLV